MKRMYRLGAEEDEASFIVDMLPRFCRGIQTP